MGVLPMIVCMYLCMHECMSRIPEPSRPEPEPSSRECMECKVIVSGEDHDALTEVVVNNLLESNGLANARDIQKIEILESLNMAIITLFDRRVAARIVRRRTINFRGKTLHFSENSVSYPDDDA